MSVSYWKFIPTFQLPREATVSPFSNTLYIVNVGGTHFEGLYCRKVIECLNYTPSVYYTRVQFSLIQLVFNQ